jgi:hypothetical protein
MDKCIDASDDSYKIAHVKQHIGSIVCEDGYVNGNDTIDDGCEGKIGTNLYCTSEDDHCPPEAWCDTEQQTCCVRDENKAVYDTGMLHLSCCNSELSLCQSRTDASYICYRGSCPSGYNQL